LLCLFGLIVLSVFPCYSLQKPILSIESSVSFEREMTDLVNKIKALNTHPQSTGAVGLNFIY